MGVVLQTANTLYGFHFLNNIKRERDAFQHYLNGCGNPIGVHLYGCGNWSIRYQDVGYFKRKAEWKTEMRQIASTINYHGPASGFDTGIISPMDGTYVEYRPDYIGQTCNIFYKRNEKMNFTRADIMTPFAPGDNFVKYSGHGNLAPKLVSPLAPLPITNNSVIKQNPSNKGQLHELNYRLRLHSFNI